MIPPGPRPSWWASTGRPTTTSCASPASWSSEARRSWPRTRMRRSPPMTGPAWPGAGALLAAIETTTGVRAEVVGKPNAPILRAALARAGGGRPLLIGDRLDTDIAGAIALGWDSLLVLTGITTRGDLAGSPVPPTYVGEDLALSSRLVWPKGPGRRAGRLAVDHPRRMKGRSHAARRPAGDARSAGREPQPRQRPEAREGHH